MSTPRPESAGPAPADWQAWLGRTSAEIAPFLGSRALRLRDGRRLRLDGLKPAERGWYRFTVKGRVAQWTREEAMDARDAVTQVAQGPGRAPAVFVGHFVADRLLREQDMRVGLALEDYLSTAPRVHLVPEALGRLPRIEALAWGVSQGCAAELIFLDTTLPEGGEVEALRAFEDRSAPPKGTPMHLVVAVDLLTQVRTRTEAAEAQARALAEAEAARARLAELAKVGGTAEGRRAMAQVDFRGAARAALGFGGAELLDTWPAPGAQGAHVVRWRHLGHRLECTVDMNMRVLDAGICLTDHDTGESYDTLLTLESLPGVVREAEETGRLVVWRRG